MTTYRDVIDEIGEFTFDVEAYSASTSASEVLEEAFSTRNYGTTVGELREYVNEQINNADLSFRDYIFTNEMWVIKEEFEEAVRGTSVATGLDDEEIDEIVSELEPGDIVFGNYEPVSDEDVKFYISPFQRENFNTVGGEMYAFIDEFVDAYNGDEVTSFDGEVPEVVANLFASQGYNIDDALDEGKVSSSKFLSSFVEEMGYSVSNPELTFLVSLHSSSIFDIINGDNRTLTVPTDAVVGIFDGANGGGALMGIELEQEWEIPVSVADLASTFGGWFIDDGGSYTPDGVYGGLHYVEVDL